MRIRKFVARSLPEALAAVKAELGESAVLLKTRTLELRQDGRSGFEVTAAQDDQPLAAPRAARRPQPEKAAPALPSGQFLPNQVVECLISRGVDELLARRLAEAWQKKGHPGDAEALETALAALIPARNDLKDGKQPIVMAFVGPTGVGKTTTLCKLAAHFVLDRKLSVQLLTADTHRFAAVEQLEAFGRHLDLKISVGYGPAELSAHREACKARILLVDTPGLGPMDEAGLEGLAISIQAVRPDQTHLCLSAATRTADLRLAAERFAKLGCDRLLFTKLDETATAGQILSALAETRLPVSYWTSGQVIPGDFHYATGQGMARLILGGETDVEAKRPARRA